ISGILTWLVPLCELGVAVLLLLPQTARTGFILSAGMLTAFSVYIALGLFQLYPRLPCSCGGILSAMSWPQHLLFNLVFLALNLCALIFHRHQHHLQIPDTRQTPFGAGKAGTEHGDPGTP
ncbi:MAG: hypothetical protein INR69_21030, partial [Mucilaginibacter polytrichastri]|nr:hypothetical protein [Mucilaginibacter polytrichastri]